MEDIPRFEKAEKLVMRNKKFFTILSYVIVLVIFLNTSFINSPAIGTLATLIYLLVNGIFLGNAFFRNESLFVRFMLGNFILITFLGTIAWLATIVYRIDIVMTAAALLIVATTCSLSNYKKKDDERASKENSSGVSLSDQASARPKLVGEISHLRILQLAYLVLAFSSFYLLYLSRAPEAHTVWDTMHPAFLPVFFLSTLTLLAIVMSPERVSYKMPLIFVHSILINSFFIFIFPASGDVGGQQTVLGNARIIYESIVPRGFGVSAESPLIVPHVVMEGFLVVFPVIFARMFAVDILWTHLFFMPVMWGIFIPLAAFMVARVLGLSEKLSVVSSMLLLLSPLTVAWGTITVPNSFGYITTFFALYFTLNYLSSAKESFPIFALAFCIISFLVHLLAGTISLIFLMFAWSFRRYKKEKEYSPGSAKTLLTVSFLFSISLLPLSLPLVRLFTNMRPYFGLYKLNGLAPEEIILLVIFGEYVNFSVVAALVYGACEVIGFFAITYFLKKSLGGRNGKVFRVCTVFLFTVFIMFLIDYRILKILLINPPFDAERLWLFQYFLALPFVAIIVYKLANVLQRNWSKALHTANPSLRTALPIKRKFATIALYALLLLALSGLVTSAVYYGYPHYGPLQTTSYEIEAAKYIDKTTKGKYVVISDLWFIYAGEIFYGIHNPRAYYFSQWDKQGTKLFVDMKNNPSEETLVEVMKYNNATTAYFVIEKPRLGTETYNSIIQRAQQNGIQTYPNGIFYYQGEEKLRIFYYPKTP